MKRVVNRVLKLFIIIKLVLISGEMLTMASLGGKRFITAAAAYCVASCSKRIHNVINTQTGLTQLNMFYYLT